MEEIHNQKENELKIKGKFLKEFEVSLNERETTLNEKENFLFEKEKIIAFESKYSQKLK